MGEVIDFNKWLIDKNKVPKEKMEYGIMNDYREMVFRCEKMLNNINDGGKLYGERE